MSHPKSSDLSLKLALETWDASVPPPNFARAVAEAAVHQRKAPRSTAQGKVAGGLLLAATFVGLGAAAAYGGWQIHPSQVVEAGTYSQPVPAPARMLFYSSEPVVAAEPEVLIPASVPHQRPPRKSSIAASPVASEAFDEAQPIHLPLCECGTSGVVCSCAE
jgi:hypothetical protein